MKQMTMLLLILLLAGVSAVLCAQITASVPLRVLTYNIRYANTWDGDDNWQNRRDYIFSLLRYQKPDVFCIQEGLYSQVQELAAALPDYQWRGVGRDDGKQQGEYSAIFFNNRRFTTTDSGTFWLSATPDTPSMGWDAACIRICTWVRFTDHSTGRDFCVFNTHFDHVGKTARENSARLILTKIKELSQDKPFLLTGDFNAPAMDIVYSIITEGAGITDTRLKSELPHHGPDSTWFGFYPGAEKAPAGIDFIFASPDVRTLSHATLSEVMENGHFSSDHLPVEAVVLMP